MSTVRVILEGEVKDYEGFCSLAKQACEQMDELEPGTLAHEWFADQEQGRFVLHELYRDEASFLTHVQNMTQSGGMDTFLSLVEIDRVTSLGRVQDPQVRETLDQFQAMPLHGVAGVVR